MPALRNHVIALHGGAGVNPDRDYAEVEVHLAALIRRCEAMLAGGASALDTVEHAGSARGARSGGKRALCRRSRVRTQ